MYSWLVTVLLLASAANSRGAQVPITSYTCTQPNIAVFLDHRQCTVSGGLRTCAIKEGARPVLLSSSAYLGVYAWKVKTNPFVVLDIPEGWCVESVKMTFVAQSSIPVPGLSVHSAERLSTNTDRTMFSLVSEDGTTPVVMNLTARAHGKYLRINMTSTGRLYLGEIAVFGTSAQVPITSYTCTQPNIPGFKDQGQCTVSRGLRMCAIKEGARPTLLSSIADLGVYGWDSNIPPYPNPFVVLDIPQGWCVGSVKMTFRAPGSIPALSLSVHSAERLSTNTDRTVYSLVSEVGTRLVVMNLTTLARGKYLRINMTSTGRLYLGEIAVFGTNDSICTHPSSAGGDPPSPTTSVGSSTDSITPIRTSDYSATSGPSSTSSQSSTIHTSACSTIFTHSSQTRTSANTTTSGPSSTPFQSSTIHSGTTFTIFTPSASTSPALSARPTTTSVHSSSPMTTPTSSQPSTTTTGGSSLTHPPMSTSFPRDTHTHNAGSTDLGDSTGVTSAVFFAGLLAGAALAGPAGALSVVCYHWKKKQAKTRGKDESTSEYKEPAYDYPFQLEENPAYEAMQK